MFDYEDYMDEYTERMLFQIAKNINTERLKQGMTVVELSDLTGITVSHLYRIEAAKRRVGLSTLLKISKALQVNLGELCVYKENYFPKYNRLVKLTESLNKKDFEDILNLIDGKVQEINKKKIG